MRVRVLYIVPPNISYPWHGLYVCRLLVKTPFSYNLIMWHIQFCLIFLHLKVSFLNNGLNKIMQLWFSLVNVTFIDTEVCLQDNQIKGVIWFKMDVVTKKYSIFIKCSWYCIWASSINCNLELFPEWRYVCTWPKYMVNRISFFSTKRPSNVI